MTSARTAQTVCGRNGCVIPLRMEAPDTGWCYVHGDRYLTEPLPLPKELGPSVEYVHQCIDCGVYVKNVGTRCRACNGRHFSKVHTRDNGRFRGQAPRIQAKRSHDWVEPV